MKEIVLIYVDSHEPGWYAVVSDANEKIIEVKEEDGTTWFKKGDTFWNKKYVVCIEYKQI